MGTGSNKHVVGLDAVISLFSSSCPIDVKHSSFSLGAMNEADVLDAVEFTFVIVFQILSILSVNKFIKSLLLPSDPPVHPIITGHHWESTSLVWILSQWQVFPHTRIQKTDRSGTPGGEGSDVLVLPLWSYATGGSWWRRLGHVPGEIIWCQRVHGCSIKLCQHANRASHWNGNNKDIL